MNKGDILGLYRFNEWANGRLMGVARTLPDEALSRDLGGSFRTLRDVVGHIVAAEWLWLERWRGVSPALPDWVGSGSLSLLLDRLAEVEARRAVYLQGLSESALDSELSFRYVSGAPGAHVLGDLLVHVVNHSTYHRGQVASMLRQVGAVPPSTDFVVFKAESRT